MRSRYWISAFGLFAAWRCEAQGLPVEAMDPLYFRVDFIVPGARPSGMAGAFIAAAQDENSSSINPAGMTYLNSPGVSTHQRWAQIEYEEPEGSPQSPDAMKRFHSTTFEQSMVNVVYPIKSFAISLFRQVQMDSRFEFETQQFGTTVSPNTQRQPFGGSGNFPGRRVNLDLELVDEALAIAYSPVRWLSLGGSARLSFFRLSLIEYLFLDPTFVNGGTTRGNTADSTYSITTLDQADMALSWDLGLLASLWRDKIFFGAVAHWRPTFTFKSDVFFPEYAINDSMAFPPRQLRDVPFEFPIPDSQGLGFYFVVTDRIRFSMDITRIEYSDLLEGHSKNAVADDTLSTGGVYHDPDGLPDLTVDDAVEFHLGAEFITKVPWLGIVPLRAGVFTNPGHRVYADTDDAGLRRHYPEAPDRTYLSFGIGAVPIRNLKFDLGLLASREVTSVTGSACLEF